ncbi:43794_t:CDS:2 [Gigaspora margarita]|uniref:43794_t:CDS:1 n=1 Tax=Gigaspora margarita TaxID=4874 RepID=A0ABN7VWK4_GIGMA|nr:43794_t:CDS:2 [Gigaspora margarita]
MGNIRILTDPEQFLAPLTKALKKVNPKFNAEMLGSRVTRRCGITPEVQIKIKTELSQAPKPQSELDGHLALMKIQERNESKSDSEEQDKANEEI